MFADEPSFDWNASQEQRPRTAVIRSSGAVLLHAAAEFAEGHDHHVVVQFRALEVIQKRPHCTGKLIEQLPVRN